MSFSTATQIMKENADAAKSFKPRKNRAQARAEDFIARGKNDSKGKLLTDLIGELERLRKDVDLMRTINSAQKKEIDTYHFEYLRERLDEAEEEQMEIEPSQI